MFDEHETIWMWAEYGDALFWCRDGGCCGDAKSLVNEHRHKRIDLTGIEGLQEWYNRFDDESYPAYAWPPEEYRAWIEEGWKYAYAVRELLPDEIELLYEYDTKGEPYPVPRSARVTPCKPMVSDQRLIREASHFILLSYNRTLDPSPYIEFIKALCRELKYEELIEPAHCIWNREEKKLTIQWYMNSLDCFIAFGPETNARGDCLGGEWSIEGKWAIDQDTMPWVGGMATWYEFKDGALDIKLLFEQLSWLILDRGLK